MSFRRDLHGRAAALSRTVVLAEGWDERVAAAGRLIEEQGLARVRLLPGPVEDDDRLEEVAQLLQERRSEKVRDRQHALELARDPVRFAAGLVALGECDAAVAGAVQPTADVLRAALWAVGPAPDITNVSSAFYMVMEDSPVWSAESGIPGVLTFTDAAVLPDPTPQQLADVAMAAAQDRRLVAGDQPVVAFLSYSTKGSAEGSRVEKVREALGLFRKAAPEIPADGELQGDAALVPEIGRRKAPGSEVAGQANVLVFPDLDSGNLAYKLVQRLAGAGAIGPIIQGLARPVADLSRGATPEDIVDVAAVAVLQSSRSLLPSDQSVSV